MAKTYDWSVWEKFGWDNNSHTIPKVRAEQVQIMRVVLTKIVLGHLQRTGGVEGAKKKRALKRFRQNVHNGAPVIRLVQDGMRLGVPYESMSAVATLLIS